MLKTYPVPGSNADRIRVYIKENPGVSVTKIWNALQMNPSPTRACLKALEEHEIIEDLPDANGHHHYYAKEPKLDG